MGLHLWDLLAIQPVYDEEPARDCPPPTAFLPIVVPDEDGGLDISSLPLFLPNGTCRITWVDPPRMYIIGLSKEKIQATTLQAELPDIESDCLNNFHFGCGKFFHIFRRRGSSWVKGVKFSSEEPVISPVFRAYNLVDAVDTTGFLSSVVDFHSGALVLSGYEAVVVIDFPAQQNTLPFRVVY